MLPQIIRDKLRLLNTFPRRLRFESFVETGLAYTFYQKNKVVEHRTYGLLGLRFQVRINVPPKPKVAFLKIGLSPNIPIKDISQFRELNEITNGELFYGSIGYTF